MAVQIHPYKRQHCWLPIGSPGHQSLVVPMLHQLQVRQVGHWEFLVAVLTTPMKCKPIVLMTVTGLMDMKYESAHTQRSVLTHVSTRNFRTLVPWLLLSSSVTTLAFSSSGVLTPYKQITTPECPQAAFWISQSLSGFLSITTYIDRPRLIQWLPCPYQWDMDLLMQISSNGEKIALGAH